MNEKKLPVLFLEPYYGGSHRQLVALLHDEFSGDVFTLPSSKWNWRMRVSALHFSEIIPYDNKYQVLFASSVLNLCELIGLRPDLSKLYKVLYFHENQLIYPVRKKQDRDFQHGYNQILSCLVADKIIFNSHYNMNSFLHSIQSFMAIIPDHKPNNLSDKIAPKCLVLYFPIQLLSEAKHFIMEDTGISNHQIQGDKIDCSQSEKSASEISRVLHIVWPHRWEHDKGPDEFCYVLTKLLSDKLPFNVSILGSHTNDIPECFQRIIPMLGTKLLHEGCLPRHQYIEVLNKADVVVSTAKHEFFGVAMLEAVFSGCYPLCPNKLVYPEIYPSECLYNTEQQLYKRLKYFCQNPSFARDANINALLSPEKFLWDHLKILYKEQLMQ